MGWEKIDMRIEEKAPGFFFVQIARDDLRIINNCINDALDLISPEEFPSRVGATPQEAQALLDAIHGALYGRK